jgi:hypothetical protein
MAERMPDEPMVIEVTLDARHELVWLRFDALRIHDLRTLIANTFAVPTDTAFTFKYKGAIRASMRRPNSFSCFFLWPSWRHCHPPRP